MEYRNKATGAVIQTDCTVSGGDWEAVRPPAPEHKEDADERKLCDTAGRDRSVESTDAGGDAAGRETAAAGVGQSQAGGTKRRKKS